MEAEGIPAGSIPDHPLIPRDEPTPITTDDELAELVEHVRGIGSFAYDTEFIGEETFYPRICLIQIGTRDRVALVDPLVDLDLTPIWELIADPAIETIVHAGQQDLEPVVRHLDRPPANIFDTQIAAGFAGRPYPLGLRPLVSEFIGVRLGKALTFTRWDRRPLSHVHARYACDDVRYLPAVRATIAEQLDAFGHTERAAEECRNLAEIHRYRFDADARLARAMGNRSLRPRGVAVLRALVVLRDRVAREMDLPPQTLLKDDVLMRLAKDPPRSTDALPAVKGLPRPVIEGRGDEIIDAVADVLRLPAAELPRTPNTDETPADRVRIDSLWNVTCSYCLGRAVDPALVANRRTIARFYFASTNGRAQPSPLLDPGWRRELIGDLLCGLLEGRRSIDLRWEAGHLRASADQEADTNE